MVDAMPGCAWGWLRPSRAVASRAAQAGGLGKREAAEPAPCLSHQPGVHRCGINHLDVAAYAALARALDRRGADRDIPRREPVRLENNDVVVGLAPAQLVGDDVLQLVHLEPVEDAALDGLDQIAGLELRLFARVAANEGCALEHDVVQLATAPMVRADRADERTRLQPLAAQHRILRRRRGD